MKFRHIKSDKYPNAPSTGVSPKLWAALDVFYKIAQLYYEICNEDPGNLFDGGWFADEPSEDIVDRLDMMGHAVASCFDNYTCSSKQMTCYVIPGITEKNYYLLFTSAEDLKRQEECIVDQLRNIAARAAREMVEWKWSQTE